MAEENSRIRIHVLHCGSITVSENVPYGNGVTLNTTAGSVFAGSAARIELPVSAYLVEHPKGLLLIDTGWSREISPDGVYDPAACKKQLPGYLAKFYRPAVKRDKTAAEQLAALGIKPSDLHTVLLTHLDADHVSGLKSLAGAGRFLLPEEEQWWSCRTVYKYREPKALWQGVKLDTFWFKGTTLGPLQWSYDLFGDESVTCVCLPGHTDGMVGIIIKNAGRFVLLGSDAVYSARALEDGVIPGFGFNPTAMRKSLNWLAQMSRYPNCVEFLANHDPDIVPHTIEL